MKISTISLDNHFHIETSAHNFVLKKEEPTGAINEKTGKEIISTDEWYFGKLSQAIDKYLNESLKAAEDVLELKARLDYIEDLIICL